MRSLLDRLFFKNLTLADLDKAMMERFSGPPVHSGVNVNEESALRYVTVYSCVRVLAETLGSLPVSVYRKRRDGGRDEAVDHRLYSLLHDEPNGEMTSQTWRETGMGHIALSGNGYSLLSLGGRGEITDIYPWNWHHIRPARARDTGLLEYQIFDRGKWETYPAERVLHIPGLGFDGIQGYSPITMAAEAVGIGLAMAQFAGRFFGQGMNVGGVLEFPGHLDETARKDLKDFLDSEGAGLANSWRPLILEYGAKFSRIPMLLRDAQFIEGQKLTDAQIAGIHRVPLHLINHFDSQPRANYEQSSLEFVMYSMLPWVTRWEQAINRRLFTRAERAQGFYCKFNLSGLLRGDYKTRQDGLHIMRQDGIINADEWRALEDMNPQEGEAGKVYLVNGNMIGVETAAKQPPRPGGSVAGGDPNAGT